MLHHVSIHCVISVQRRQHVCLVRTKPGRTYHIRPREEHSCGFSFSLHWGLSLSNQLSAMCQQLQCILPQEEPDVNIGECIRWVLCCGAKGEHTKQSSFNNQTVYICVHCLKERRVIWKRKTVFMGPPLFDCWSVGPKFTSPLCLLLDKNNLAFDCK